MTFKIYILFLFFSLSSFTSSETNSIAAIVNDSIITFNELNKYTKKDDSKKKRLAVLDLLIEKKIEIDVIEKLKINIPDKEIQEQLLIISKKNNVDFTDLIARPDIKLLISQIQATESIKRLKKIVIENEKNKEKNQDNNLSPEDLYKNWLEQKKVNTYIKIYEEKFTEK